MKVDIDYRAATILKEAATETKYFNALGNQVTGTALLGIFFFSRLLDNCETIVFALAQNRKWDAICSLKTTVIDIVVLASFTFAHMATCVTALFWQAHRMHNLLGTKELEIKDPQLLLKLSDTLQFATNQVVTLRKENAQLEKALNNPHIERLRQLKTFIVNNLSDDTKKAAVPTLIDKIIQGILNNASSFPLNTKEKNTLISAFNGTKTNPETTERAEMKAFFGKVFKSWNEFVQAED